uniref:Uncharacterized protein n=1 Tax=Anguilla anguilla TaxID=7936 RepID=A0A0E9Q2V3_ANGAN
MLKQLLVKVHFSISIFCGNIKFCNIATYTVLHTVEHYGEW